MSKEKSPLEDNTEPIFKIKEVHRTKGDEKKGTAVVVEDKTQIKALNAYKEGKYARLPFYCNTCVLRPKDAGGSVGGCPVYEKDSICSVDAKYEEFIEKWNTREPDQLRDLIDTDIKTLKSRINKSDLLSAVDGGIPDKNTLAYWNTLLRYYEFASRLQQPNRVTAGRESSDGEGNFIREFFTTEKAS